MSLPDRRPALSNILLLCAAAAILASCNSDNGNGNDADVPDTATADRNIQAAYVLIGDGNQATIRAVTVINDCPLVAIDGVTTRMTQRVAADTPAQRTTVSAAADSKASAFPVTVCEASLPSTARRASIGSRSLPIPVASPQRVLILADTGCRLQKSSNIYQPCNDPSAWPLPTIAKAAAALKPDLVLHIGDYHYRENACPSDIAGCTASPWGYGWDTWRADLLDPAASLLAAAPWVVTRGNHEECARAGQGWYRLLDTMPYTAGRSCDDPANDTAANYEAPYAVKVGSDTQFVVFDSAKIGGTALSTTDPVFQTYSSQFQKVAALTANAGINSIFVNHHPILGFTPVRGAAPASGNAALQSVLAPSYPTSYLPTGVQLVLHGHVHDFQAINFSTRTPATIVSGNGGDNLDVNLPDPFPANTNPAPNTKLSAITHTSTFGFMLMERVTGTTNWRFTAYTAGGTVLTTCTQAASQLNCDKTGYLTP